MRNKHQIKEKLTNKAINTNHAIQSIKFKEKLTEKSSNTNYAIQKHQMKYKFMQTNQIAETPASWTAFWSTFWSWLMKSSKHNFATGLTYSPVLVFTRAALTLPSGPGRTLTTLTNGQVPRQKFGSTIKTTSFSSKFFLSVVHFLLSVKYGTYSFNHLLQNWLTRTWTTFQRFLKQTSGHKCSASLRNTWPQNQRCSLVKYPAGIPRLQMSAGFNRPGMCRHRALVVDSNISPIRFATNVWKRQFRDLIHCNTVMESVQKVASDRANPSSLEQVIANLTPETAPCSSKRGTDNNLIGATRAFDMTKFTHTWFSSVTRIWTTAPNPFSDASVHTWRRRSFGREIRPLKHLGMRRSTRLFKDWPTFPCLQELTW